MDALFLGPLLLTRSNSVFPPFTNHRSLCLCSLFAPFHGPYYFLFFCFFFIPPFYVSFLPHRSFVSLGNSATYPIHHTTNIFYTLYALHYTLCSSLCLSLYCFHLPPLLRDSLAPPLPFHNNASLLLFFFLLASLIP